MAHPRLAGWNHRAPDFPGYETFQHWPRLEPDL
jgi:hypothetical protein